MTTADFAGQILSETDRRASLRHDKDDDALTFVKGDSDAISCVVRDISDGGARLILKRGEFIPKQFKLCVPEMQILADCELVWRNKKEIGLKFRSVVDID